MTTCRPFCVPVTRVLVLLTAVVLAAGCGEGPASPAVIESAASLNADVAPPNAPSDLQGDVVSATRIDVSWSDNSGDEDNFRLQRRVWQWGPGTWSGWSRIATPAADQTGFSDTGVIGGRYQYRVAACNAAGCSAFSPIIRVMNATVPASPAGIEAHAYVATEVHVEWLDASTNENGFQVHRRHRAAADVPWDGWQPLTTLASNSVHTDDETVVTGHFYQYRVRACNVAGCSAWNVGRQVIADPLPYSPTDVVAGAARVNDNDQVDVWWTDNSDIETSFEVERQMWNGAAWGAWTPLAVRPANSIGNHDPTVSAGTRYRYRVRACNAPGCSPWANSNAVDTIP